MVGAAFVMKLLIFIFSLAVARSQYEENPMYNCTYCQPEQIHIAFGENVNDIVVTWSTFNDTEESCVQYGVGAMDQEAIGYHTMFVGGRTSGFIALPSRTCNLTQDMAKYHCGSVYGWSARYSFKTPPEGEDWTVSAAIYGDLGYSNGQSLSYLQEETERDMYHFILHVGDIAYNMDFEEGRVGDQFMRPIEPIAAIVPYMTVAGNHEEFDNFTQYKSRFSMPNMADTESMYYSWNIGPVHFVGINTEAWYYRNYGDWPLIGQFEWLKKDLAEANQPENREKHPWLIIYGHRPMYCSNFDTNNPLDCRGALTRFGFNGTYSLEPLLKEFGVDIVIWAHEHNYERTLPLYNNTVYNGTVEEPYVNPRAPVHIITGSAGCAAHANDTFSDQPEWSAFRSFDYGYTRFVAYNHTHVYLEQVSTDKKGDIIDSIWVIKDSHGPYQF